MPTIDATPAGASANSYITLQEFKDYIATKSHVSAAVAAASDAVLTVAAIEGTRAINAYFVWTGIPTTDAQALPWPMQGQVNRNGRAIGTMILPVELKNATAEFSLQMIDEDRTEDDAIRKFGLTGLGAGPVNLRFSDSGAKGSSIDLRDADNLETGPEYQWKSAAVPDLVRQLLVPSWYKRPMVRRPFVLEAMGGTRDGNP